MTCLGVIFFVFVLFFSLQAFWNISWILELMALIVLKRCWKCSFFFFPQRYPASVSFPHYIDVELNTSKEKLAGFWSSLIIQFCLSSLRRPPKVLLLFLFPISRPLPRQSTDFWSLILCSQLTSYMEKQYGGSISLSLLLSSLENLSYLVFIVLAALFL